MKKKIKDLTKKDVNKICNKRHEKDDSCKDCPLFKLPLLECDLECYETIKELKKYVKILDKKVKVE